MGKSDEGEQRQFLERPSAVSPGKIYSLYQDEGLNVDNSDDEDDHELEKRRFNAWAGKRSLLTKRRFNAWAGRR
jgi:hypothetical protein